MEKIASGMKIKEVFNYMPYQDNWLVHNPSMEAIRTNSSVLNQLIRKI